MWNINHMHREYILEYLNSNVWQSFDYCVFVLGFFKVSRKDFIQKVAFTSLLFDGVNIMKTEGCYREALLEDPEKFLIQLQFLRLLNF